MTENNVNENNSNKSIEQHPEPNKIQDKIQRTLEYYHDMDNPEYDDIEKDILKTGLSIPEFKRQFIRDVDAMMPHNSESIIHALPSDENIKDMYAFKNSVWDDFSTHFGNGINRIGYGLGVTIPGITAAFNKDDDSPEWVEDWIKEVGDWYEKSEGRSSEESNQSFFETGSLRAFAGGMGSGAASMAPMILGFIPYVGQAAYIGTTFGDVFGSVLKSGKDNGLSLEDSSRMALSLAPIITGMEYLGKTGIAKSASGVLSKEAAKLFGKAAVNTGKAGIRKSVNELAKKGFTREALEDFMKVSIKDLGTKKYAKAKAKDVGGAFLGGAASEGVTETTQSILEQVGESVYDTYFADENAKVGDGKYGTKLGSKEFWLQATEEGFYGAILGGIMSGGGAVPRNLKQQSTYHYVRNAVETGKMDNIKALKNYAAKEQANGKMTKKELNNFVSTVDEMVDSEKRVWHKLNDANAKYQSYNNLKIKDSAESISTNPWYTDEIAKDYPDKKKEITSLLGSIVDGTTKIINEIAEQGKPVPSKDIAPDLESNVKRLNELLPNDLKISELNVSESHNEGKIQNLKDGKPITEEFKDGKETDFGKVYQTKDGIKITQKAIDNADVIKQKVSEALAMEKEDKAKAIEEIKQEYGIDKDAANFIYKSKEGIDVDSLTEVEIEAKNESQEITGQTISKSEIQKSIKDDLGVDFEFNVDNTFEQPTSELKGIKDQLKVQKAVDRLSKAGYSPSKRVVVQPTEETTEITGEKTRQKPTAETTEKQGVTGEEIVGEKLSKKSQESYDTLSKQYPEQPTKEDVEDLEDFISSLNNTPKDSSIRKGAEKLLSEMKEKIKDVGEIKSKKESISELRQQSSGEVVNEVKTESTKEPETIDEINQELEKDDISEERRKELIEKQAKKNKEIQDKQSNELYEALGFSDIFNETKPKEQRKEADAYESDLIKDNFALYEKIKGHFAKIFPNISVKELDNLGEKYGAKVLARLVERGIEINKNEAIQSSLIHEYAHVYLEILGDNHPLVKLGYKLIEGTSFDIEAQRLYPDKTRKEQLNEALTEAIAQNSLNKLKVKFEGSALDKFKEWAKRFWNKIKSFFTKQKSRDIVSILSDGLTLQNTPYSVGVNLVGVNKDQRKKSINPRFLKTVDIVNASLIKQKLKAIEGNTALDHKNREHALLYGMGALYQRYRMESVGLYDNDIKLFQGRVYSKLSKEQISKENLISEIEKFSELIKVTEPQLYKHSLNTINTITKINLDLDEKEESIDEDNNQDDTDSGKDKTPIKASKAINQSVRSVLAAIVDEEGNKTNIDAVIGYVSRVSNNTVGPESLMDKINEDAKGGNLYARRLSAIVNLLEDGQRIGLLKTLSSLIQVEFEGTNIARMITEVDGEETVSYRVTSPIINRSKDFYGLKDRLFKMSKDDKSFFDIKNLTSKGHLMVIGNYVNHNKISNKLDSVTNELSKLLGVTVTKDDLHKILSVFPATENYTSVQRFGMFLGGNKASIKLVIDGKMELSDISGYITNIYKSLGVNPINNTTLNGAGNMISSTQTGHWVSELNSMLENNVGKRMDKMLSENSVYKDNSVLKYFKENGISWSKFDSIKNLNLNSNSEYINHSTADYLLNQFAKFASTISETSYKQTLGVLSNRDSILFFDVPKYTKSRLIEEYDKQVVGLTKILNKQLEGKSSDGKAKVINDFNKLYVHKATIDSNGKAKVESGYGTLSKEIKDFKSVLTSNNLEEVLVRDKNKNLDELIENFYYTEALNRSYLNDIYGGISLLHTNDKKGAVENSVKRMSLPTSNGEKIELKKKVYLVVHDGMNKDGTKNNESDSFKINGRHLSNYLKKASGTLDPVGGIMKDNVMQVDPITGEQLIIKNSSKNLDENKIDSHGNGYKRIFKAIMAIEDSIGDDAHIMFIDKSALKGTYSDYEIHNYEELLEKIEGGNIPKFNSVKIDNYRVPFNLDNKYKPVHEQNTILGTQGAGVQFNSENQEAIKAFDNVLVQMLKNNLGVKDGDYQNSFVEKVLSDVTKVADQMIKDLEQREKTTTSEIIEAVVKYNKQNPDNKINALDHDSVRPIFEQFVASRLTSKGIRVEIAGNFLHQLPDMGIGDEKLGDYEVAVSWRMFFNEKPTSQQVQDFLESENNKVAVVRIPTSSEVSMFAGKVKYFLDTDDKSITLSDRFVKVSDSDHDGDKVMVYRQEIKEDGTFNELSSKTTLFNYFYKHLSSDEFIRNSNENDLDLDRLESEVNEIDRNSGRKSEKDSYAINSLIKAVNVASKMKVGAAAVGRFAIASKITNALSQFEEKLINSINFKGKTYKEFTNKELPNLAVLLQAALDIGNKPVLTKTGYNNTTIDVGNAMLTLGVPLEEVINLLKSDEVQSMVADFEKSNNSFTVDENISFNKFFNGTKEVPGYFDKNPSMELSSFKDFKEISDGLASFIGYIQLDKGLSNTSQLNRALLDNVSKFKDLPFTTGNITERVANKHRLEVAKMQDRVYYNTLLSSNTTLNKSIEKDLGKKFFNFKNQIPNIISHYVSQHQLSKQRKDVDKFMVDLPKKLSNIKDKIQGREIKSEPKQLVNAYNDITNAITPESKEEAYNYHYKKSGKYFAKTGGFDSRLKKYEESLNELKSIDKFKGNPFFDFLVFEELDDRLLMKYNPQFKMTETIKKEAMKGFEELQELDPNLAKDIIDYQLYRFGVNNKIGSMIEVLPIDIDIKMMKDSGRIKNSLNTNSIKEITNNVVQTTKEKSSVKGKGYLNFKISKFDSGSASDVEANNRIKNC